MQHKEKQRLLKYLNDALFAAEEIDSYKELSLESISKTDVRWVIERGIEIISEALKRALQIENELPITNLYKIFATRNKIAHEYDIVDPYFLYTILKKSIPTLNKRTKPVYKKAGR